MSQAAIGFIETRGLVGIIEAADAAAKSASVEIVGFEPIGAGLISVRFAGDVASVQAAVQAGVEAARQVGEVISHHVIPAPHADLAGLLRGTAEPPPVPTKEDSTKFPTHPSAAELKKMPVARLRQLVRQTPGTHLKGRQISHANKSALIAELRRAWQGESH
ncbi:MAG: BMC domain-containing protein [Gemmatimonadetes bacterium]|nr:BMC domain-containing protein [Gemmatimonadota bacterium]